MASFSRGKFQFTPSSNLFNRSLKWVFQYDIPSDLNVAFLLILRLRFRCVISQVDTITSNLSVISLSYVSAHHHTESSYALKLV